MPCYVSSGAYAVLINLAVQEKNFSSVVDMCWNFSFPINCDLHNFIRELILGGETLYYGKEVDK